MDPSLQPLVEYINSHRYHGTPDAVTRQELLAVGWPEQMVDGAFRAAGSDASTVQAYPSAAPDNQLPATPIGSAPSKYTNLRALNDVFTAISANWLAFTVAIILTVITTIALYTIVTIGFSAVFAAGTLSSLAFLRPSLGMIVAFILLLILLGSVVQALLLNSIALSLKDGANGQRSNALQTVKSSFMRMPRVVVASALTYVIILGPLVVIVVPVIIWMVFSRLGGASPSPAVNIITILLPMFGIAWMLIALLRYALTPYVALLEPNVPLLKTPGRSYHLLKKGGQWFLFKGFLLTFLILVIMSLVSGLTVQEIDDSDNPLLVLSNIALGIMVYGVLYMLYRNRVAVKG